ncbi:MAG: helix-turn-helix transcriptional regulator [Pseudomonadales bacterium]|nr:helix-turn-helix transcriptional regulator [Pseudomonadales bacterium]MCP5331044.1 helix-turn-helix transcriptional regulator [Pseudomonadales bacterium]MCP5343507.1 helix-turn-helix transcriptional regulator [Pseudomonadales bacterium]
MDTHTIGKLIRETRQGLGMRQDELASVANISIRALSNIENGKHTAHIGLVLNTLAALGIEMCLTPPSGSQVSEVKGPS